MTRDDRGMQELEERVRKLTRINQVLMTRVEQAMDSQGSAFSVFQTAVLLEAKVKERTQDLGLAMEDLRRANVALELAREDALAASRAKSDFLATMSHEIRTPLNGVIGLARLLGETGLSAEQRGYLESIRSSGEVLLDLVEDVLDFSRIEAGRLQLESRAYSPAGLAAEVRDLFAQRCTSSGINLRMDLGADVPPAVLGDPTRLRQVLLNLLGNALKFTQRGEIVLAVATASVAGAPMLRCSVRDTGVGMEAETLPRLFQVFTQADASTTRRHGGSGLGLAICRRLVELMGGAISVQSTPGQGSVFTFTVRGPPGSLPPAAASGGAHTFKVSARILVVEDNRVNLLVATRTLQKLGATVDNASNGLEAIKAVRDVAYDLIFMDCQMPELDGYNATRAIRTLQGNAAHVPIVALTANALAGDELKCREAGMDGHLAKPLHVAQLQEALRTFLPSRCVVECVDHGLNRHVDDAAAAGGVPNKR
jgi:signal transduction histidine kinase/ActR/RegA family two-component response regulator